MMTNFDFLKEEPLFDAFSDACIEAEEALSESPVLCVLSVQKSAELAVRWLYAVDDSLRFPHKGDFAALVYNQTFLSMIDERILDCLKCIIKLGSYASRTNARIKYPEAVLALGSLFEITMYVDYCYGSSYRDRHFEEAILSGDRKQNLTAAELIKRKSQLEGKTQIRIQMAENMKSQRQRMNAVRLQNQKKRQLHLNSRTEADTRKNIIDLDLRSMGWVFGKDCLEEVQVTGMMNPSGTGSVDYVLYGNDNKPVAVVEAKRTTKDPEAGREQAYEYANCLCAQYQQMPYIFYTNGYTTWFWDSGNYPPRKVYSVFSKKDLQRMMDRKPLIRAFDQLNINPSITNRYYQKMAIQRVCEEYAKKRRKALLVMATGTGKTRTAISLVDVLQKHRWITNILFLADRVELVRQAKREFIKHLPNLSTCNLLERGEDKPTDRAIFSTYPTMLNAINEEMTEDGQRIFTPGYFDLIIIDEAHRSIFKKYRAIFEYFDALLVGLTATPKDDVEHNTYEFFDLQDNLPTYAYEYEEARDKGYLADYHCIEKLYQIPTKGIKYDDLTPEQRNQLEDAFDEEETPEFISGTEIDSVYFNKDTTRRILMELMEKGLKVEGGDKLGKTIIFARRHNHASFIEHQFDILYPQYKGEFARVIDHQVKHNDRLLEQFKDPNKLPQIAISVDMLDTGIDIPEVVNLVFYKQVFSKSKFWQMFGRGTRRCEDLFGPGKDKEEFYIFDYMGNFQFFSQNPQGKESEDAGSLSEQAFSLKVQIIRELQKRENQTDYLRSFRQSFVNDLRSAVSSLNRQEVQVHQEVEYVDKYMHEEAYQYLDIAESDKLTSHLGPLISNSDGDENARRFDVLMYQIMLAQVTGDQQKYDRFAGIVKQSAELLFRKMTIPEVRNAEDVLIKICTKGFWKTAELPDLEDVRCEVRNLMCLLRREIKEKIINVTDEIIFEREGERFTQDNKLESYYERACRYVEENKEEPVLLKLKNNIPLNGSDWQKLEEIFWTQIGTEQEYQNEIQTEEHHSVPLGKFVRALTGLDESAANEAFSEFLDTGVYTEEQIFFVKCIVDYITKYGTLEQKEMADDEFASGLSIVDVFEDRMSDFHKIMSVVAQINANAMRQVA